PALRRIEHVRRREPDVAALRRLWNVHAEHVGDVGGGDTAVEQADRQAHRGEREGEVYGDGGLADAAFAAEHGDDVTSFTPAGAASIDVFAGTDLGVGLGKDGGEASVGAAEQFA